MTKPFFRTTTAGRGVLTQWLAVCACLALLAAGRAPAQSCGSIPATYPVTAGSGNLNVGNGSQVNGTAISGSGSSVQMNGIRTSATPTFPALSPASYPSFSSNTNTSATTIPAGTYSNVNLGSGTTTFSGGTYYISSLSASSSNTTLQFGAGTYYLTNANLTGSSLVISVTGAVVLNIGSNFSTGSGSLLNSGGTVTNLRIYLYPNANVNLGSSTNLTGVIYGPGSGNNVNVNSGVTIQGLLAVNSSITLSGSDTVTLSGSNQSAIAGMSTCGVTVGPNHYAVAAAGSAVNCSPEPINIYARDSSDNNVATTDTITLSTSTGHGDWSLGSGNGSFTAGASNSGNASYTYASSDAGTVRLLLRDTYPETVTVGVTDGSITALTSEDSAITFAPSGFRITNGSNSATTIGTQVAGVTSTQSLAWQAIRTDTTTGACTTVFASGSTAKVSLAYQCNNPTSCVSGQTLSVTNNGTTTSLAANPNSGITSYTSAPLTFSTSNGEAPFTLQYTDAGQITLAVLYNIPLKSGAASSTNMTGSSQFVVRPYTLALSNIKATSGGSMNPGASTASGTAFVKAGQAFTATVTATNYQGNTTPNFGQETTPAAVTLTPALVLPSTGDNPAVSGSFGTYSGGTATGTAFGWPEVGIITLTPTVAGYLGTSGITGTVSGNVGRFIPNAFTVGILSPPVFGTACSGGGFTYVGQPFVYTVAPVIPLTAVAVGGGITQNYTGSFMRLTNSSLGARTYTPTPSSPALTLTGLPATSVDPVIADLGSGRVSLTFSAGSGLSFTRGSAIAPFSAVISLAETVTDQDGVAAPNPVTFGAAGGIAFSAGANQLYGRMAVRNALGSELLDLPVPLTTQYYYGTGQGFVTNANDSCTAAPALAFSNYQQNLVSGKTCVRDSGNPGVSGIGCAAAASSPYAATAIGGNFNLILAAPGSGYAGTVTVTATAPAYLQYLWSAASGSNSNPAGLGTFGVFPGSTQRVYQREVY